MLGDGVMVMPRLNLLPDGAEFAPTVVCISPSKRDEWKIIILVEFEPHFPIWIYYDLYEIAGKLPKPPSGLGWG